MTDTKSPIDDLYYRLKSLPDNHLSRDIIVLESQHPDHPESNQTYIAAFSDNYLVVNGADIEWKSAGKQIRAGSDPWEALETFRASAGWVFGYIGYDAGKPHSAEVTLNRGHYKAPDIFFMEPEYLFRIDETGIEQLKGKQIDSMRLREPEECHVYDLTSEISKEKFIERVNAIKHLIAEGDFYELNFSYPITASFEGHPYDLYRKMRQISPVPFASYLELDKANLSVCCSSPERFLKKTGRRVMSEPIKGTSARGNNAAEDALFRNELKSKKNEAENLMIVDLVRHDLSAVCEPGSIDVSKLFEIQTFGTVHQLISRVEGTVSPEVSPADIIKACFPMGSMTGAPKIRVMKRIGELETYRRGIYSGAIGYFTPDGDFDFNVVIRTAIIDGGRLVYPVGGAITGDSDAIEEWNETLVKSKALRLIQKKMIRTED